MKKFQQNMNGRIMQSASRLTIFLMGLACTIMTGTNALAQPGTLWDRTIGGSGVDRLYAASPTSDGGYILGGHTIAKADGNVTGTSRGKEDFWVVKITSLGYVEWDRVIGGPQADYLRSVVQTADGGYILAGHSFSRKGGDKSDDNRSGNEQTGDFWIVKLSADGTKEWDKTYGGSKTEEVNAVIQTTDGGYLVGGTSDSPAGGNKTASSAARDFWVVKLAANGSKQWDKTYGGSSREDFADLRQTADGGFILGGSTSSPQSTAVTTGTKGSSDYWLVKISGNGTKQWDKTYGGNQTDKMNRLQITADGGFILGGYSSSSANGDKTGTSANGFNDFWVVKVNAAGTKQWDKTFGQNGPSVLTTLIQMSDGGYALGGHTAPDYGQTPPGSVPGDDFWVIKISANGNKTWDRIMGGDGDTDQVRALAETYGGIMVFGTSNSESGYDKTEDTFGTNGNADFWLLRLDSQTSSGSLSWERPSLDFSVTPEDPADSQTAYLLTGDGEMAFATLIKTDNTPWLDMPPGAAGGTSIWVNAAGMSPGQYSATITAFTQGYRRARLSIYLYIAGDDPAKRTVRINAGGQEFDASNGRTFMADQFFSGVDRVSTIPSGDILHTTDDVLYRSGRSSSAFSYHIPVSNGTVDLVLHFAETWYGAPGRGPGGAGRRQFHVDVEGNRKLTNFDIYAAAGGAMRAVTQTIPVTVTDGSLDIDFISGAADLPRLSAIEVVTTRTEVAAIADAYVRPAYAYDNFGSEGELNIKRNQDNAESVRSSYIKFAVPQSIPVGVAKLRIYGRNVESSKGVILHAYGVGDDRWVEHEIADFNAPVANDQSLASVSVNNVLKYYELDVTSFVKSRQQAGDAIVSFKLDDPANRNLRLVFNSRENASNPPQLLIVAAQAVNPAARVGGENIAATPARDAPSTIYPNPAKAHLNISIAASHAGKITLSLVSLNGREHPVRLSNEPKPGMLSEAYISNLGLESGLYLLKIQSNKKTEVVKVLIGAH